MFKIIKEDKDDGYIIKVPRKGYVIKSLKIEDAPDIEIPHYYSGEYGDDLQEYYVQISKDTEYVKVFSTKEEAEEVANSMQITRPDNGGWIARTKVYGKVISLSKEFGSLNLDSKNY